MASFNILSFIACLYHLFSTSNSQCSSSVDGDVSSYTVAQNACSNVDCIDDYDCEISCDAYACADVEIYGPNTGYDLSVDCSNSFACQRVEINKNNDNTEGDIYAVFDSDYTGNDGMMYTTNAGTITLDCLGNRGCAHFSIYAESTESDFVDIDITCQPSSSSNSHICYDFTIDGTNYYRGNLKMLCDVTNGCQNSNIGSPMFGSVSITCSDDFACAGSNLGTILNNDDIDNEVINNYADGYGTYECTGDFSCQTSTLYCPNYKDCSITCDGSSACDGTTIYCPKYGGTCNLDCTNGCNSVTLYTYNSMYEINDDSSVTVSNTVIDLSQFNIVESDGGYTGTGGNTNNDDDSDNNDSDNNNSDGSDNDSDSDNGSSNNNDDDNNDNDSGNDSGSSNSSANDSSSSSDGDSANSALTVVAIILALLIVIVLGYIGYSAYKKNMAANNGNAGVNKGVNNNAEQGMATHITTNKQPAQYITPVVAPSTTSAPTNAYPTNAYPTNATNVNTTNSAPKPLGARPARPPPPRPKKY